MPQDAPTDNPFGFSRRYACWWLALLIVLAAFIRIDGVGKYYYSPDETMHIGMARGDDALQVMRFSLSETHPPVGNLLRHYWETYNASPAYMRSEGLLFSLGLIALYYAIGAQLGGRFAGMCCAALVAFSFGAITQSYMVRNYAFFLVFLSAAFYCYLRWRDTRSDGWLLCYILLGTLACLTHFSGIFTCFAVALYELIALLRHKQGWRIVGVWCTANAIIAATFLLIFGTWYNDVAVALNAYLHVMLPKDLWKYSFIFPQGVLHYILPYRSATGYGLGMFIGVLLLWVFAFRRNPQLRPLLLFTLLAFALGMALFATAIYPFPGERHALWMFPFVITATGWALADALARIATPLCARHPYIPIAVSVAIVFAGWIVYSPADRFADTDEYPITQRDWQALNQRLGTLDFHDLILADRGDVFLMNASSKNPYRDASHTTLSNPFVSATMVIYGGKTHLLYNTMRAHLSDRMLIDMTLEANRTGLLDSVDRLVFLQSVWTARIWRPVVNLMLCDDLDKQVVTFPPTPLAHRLTRDDIYAASASLLFVSKKAFLEEAIAPTGKAHHCL
jgi:hypothetical protein